MKLFLTVTKYSKSFLSLVHAEKRLIKIDQNGKLSKISMQPFVMGLLNEQYLTENFSGCLC